MLWSKLSVQRQGELSVLSLTFIEAWFPILALSLVSFFGGLTTYALATGLATVFFVVILIYQQRLSGLLNREARWNLLMTAFGITTLFVLVFMGLQYTTAGNMAVILFLQVLFSYLYFNVLGREPMSLWHIVGALFMTVGALMVLFPEKFNLNLGDAMILAAAAIAPLANRYQQRARKQVDSVTLLAFRNLFALPFLWLLALSFEGVPSLAMLQQSWLPLLLVGLLIMGFSKLLWIEAIHRISITKTSALAALSPLFTLLLAYWLLNETPSLQQMLGMVPILLGGLLITRRLPVMSH